ncbi:MAG: hypothetical protein A3G70_00240 [Planctomycetes bacterium RIFCSPLOWO2_12_FULL_39_13]|nr:MAG: hypothetical protein A2Y09_02280 [Planctomycetes bacterium GWA2_39_15]OHB41512.1 MAG: hypothetical protein A2Y11_04480 [Planctomycetes bacterium GWC2_39_26]OHB98997.1 MAG: hypothetical protein A3G70_00240 [Planctomycetes bacterium RIFCSPLOWO2_12_FULL_39_13]
MKKRIRLYLQRLIGNFFDGTFSSYLNAPHGLELDELRQYQPGDNLRSVDWKATAKTGKLHVRMKLVDKRVTIIFLVDKSRSEKFGSFINTKEDIQSRVLSILVYAASETGNEIGFITFTDKVENYIQPKAGEKEALKNVKDILLETPSSNCTDLNVAFKFLNEKIPSTALVFILSDFLAPYNYEQSFKTLSYLHEVIPVIISDRMETNLPRVRGFITAQDVETGTTGTLDIATTLEKIMPYVSLFKKLNTDYIGVSTEEDEEICVKKISEFFDKRIRRGGRRRR